MRYLEYAIFFLIFLVLVFLNIRNAGNALHTNFIKTIATPVHSTHEEISGISK